PMPGPAKGSEPRRAELPERAGQFVEFSAGGFGVFRSPRHVQSESDGKKESADLVGGRLEIFFAVVQPGRGGGQDCRVLACVGLQPAEAPRAESQANRMRDGPARIDASNPVMS